MKIELYQVVSTYDIAELPEKVMQYIKNGWQPLGGLSVDPDDGSYHQTIVKYAPDPKVTVSIDTNRAAQMPFTGTTYKGHEGL